MRARRKHGSEDPPLQGPGIFGGMLRFAQHHGLRGRKRGVAISFSVTLIADSPRVQFHLFEVLRQMIFTEELGRRVMTVSPSLAGNALDHPLACAWVGEVPIRIMLLFHLSETTPSLSNWPSAPVEGVIGQGIPARYRTVSAFHVAGQD